MSSIKSKTIIEPSENDIEKGEVDFVSSSISNFEEAYEEGPSLKREFKSRHVNMISVAGAIGTGLVIGSGSALLKGGPGSLFIAYLMTGINLYVVLISLGEMAAFSSDDKGFSGFSSRYVDKALGFATGWNYFFKYAIVYPTNLTAVGIVIHYWRPDLNVGIWVAVFLVVILAINLLHVKYFGEVEFWLSAVKILVLVTLIITCIVITSGGTPAHHKIGFHYWRDPGAFAPYLVEGSTGRFLGFWACLVQSCFAYVGSEVVGIAFGEAPNPEKTIRKSSFQSLFRIATFYVIGVFVLGLCVPYDSDILSSNASKGNAAASPFVVAIKLAQIKVMPDVINACLLVFIISSANSDIYIGSRTLYALAKEGYAPKILMLQTKQGIPWVGCLVTSAFGLLAFMNTKSSSATIFGYFSSAVTVFGTINWINILLSYICYHRATIVQQVPTERIPFRSWGQPYIAYASLIFTGLITFFNGYNAFIHGFKYRSFITSYIGIAAYVIMILGWKFTFKTKRVTSSTVDFRN